MKNLFKARMKQILGIIAFVAVIGLLMGVAHQAQAQAQGNEIGRITITNIPAAHNNKVAMLMVQTGSVTRAWSMTMPTITRNSATFNLLDWENNLPTTIGGEIYSVTILIGESMDAISNSQYLYTGIIPIKALSGRGTVSIRFRDFMSF